MVTMKTPFCKMSFEERINLLKSLKYYAWMTEEEKTLIFAGMLQFFSTIKRVKLRAKCDLFPKLNPRPKMMDSTGAIYFCVQCFPKC